MGITYALVGEVRVVNVTGSLELAVTWKGVVRGTMLLRTALAAPAMESARRDALRGVISLLQGGDLMPFDQPLFGSLYTRAGR